MRNELVEKRLVGEPTFEKMVSAYSLDAVAHAASNGVTLDYSDSSIALVENILARLEQSKPKGIGKLLGRGPSEDDLQTMAKLYGCYVGEVLRFELALGEWRIAKDGPFDGMMILDLNGTQMSPQAKVYKRLTDGPEDNVAHYYQVAKENSMTDRES